MRWRFSTSRFRRTLLLAAIRAGSGSLREPSGRDAAGTSVSVAARTPSSIAIRTSSGRLFARIFSMTRARWISTVRGLMSKPVGDNLIRIAGNKKVEDLALARCQAFEPRGKLGIDAILVRAR